MFSPSFSRCYDTLVTNREHFSIPDNLPQLRSDLSPLYDLKPEDYNRIINELTNLLIVTTHSVRQLGNVALAHILIDRAVEILRDYDDDVVEVIKQIVDSDL